MKKVVRTVWISLLSGLALLVACTSPRGLTRAEKKQLKANRVELLSQIDENHQRASIAQDPKILYNLKVEEMQLRDQLSVINSKLGDSDSQAMNAQEMGTIVTEMDSLQAVIKSNEQSIQLLYGPPIRDPEFIKAQRRQELQNRLDQLNEAIHDRENSCIYGSPEVMQRYREETNRLRDEAADVRQQIEDLDHE